MGDYLSDIQQKRVFTKQDIVNITGDVRRAESVLLSYQKRSYIQKIRRDMYCALNLATHLPEADRFEIVCSIQPEAYIAYHSALEFHGLAQQLWYDVQVAVLRPFTPFQFSEATYLPIVNKCSAGIEEPLFRRGVRVTNLERTIVDCIIRMDLCGGGEEFIHCIEAIRPLRSNMLVDVLEAYDTPVVYQKVGCVLDVLQLPIDNYEPVLQLCQEKAGRAVNLLTQKENSNSYQSKWKLYIPECLTQSKVNNHDII